VCFVERAEKIKVGDKVLATDPKTGKSRAEPVIASFAGTKYKNLVRISVDTDGRRGHHTGIIVATEHHLFWNETSHIWTRADHLTTGTTLRTTGGTRVRIIRAVSNPGHPAVRDLSISNLHAYYVQAGTILVLVHNSGCETVNKGKAGEARAAQELQDRGYEIVGEQISVRTAAANVRIDIVATRGGQTYFFDAKNGKYAGFTKNQGRLGGYDAISSSGGEYYGRNAKDAGLSGSFGARDVHVIQYP
jgi:hypothetical protein